MVESARPQPAPGPTQFLLRGLGEESGPVPSEIASGKQPAAGRGRRRAEPGPQSPGTRPPRPQHPRSSARGRGRPSDPAQTAVRPGPAVPSQLRGGRVPARLPAPAGLPAGPAGGRRRRPASPGQRPPPAHPPAPAALRPPPPRSGTLAFLLRAPDVQPAARVRAPSCAQVEAARQAPREKPSQAPSPGPAPGMQGREWTAPHLRLIHTCRRPGRRGRGSAQAPPLARPLLRPPRPLRAGGGGRKRPGPGARAPALCLLPRAQAGPRSFHCSARRSGALEFGGGSRSHRSADGHRSLLRVGASHRESELRKGEGAHLREPVRFSRVRSRIQI